VVSAETPLKCPCLDPHLCVTLVHKVVEGEVVNELERALDTWLAAHAPAHRQHHVQVGGGAVLCVTCGLADLSDPEQASLALAVA
jgi:hypothetical protein